MDYIVCQIGKSESKKNAELTAYKNEIKDYLKTEIDLYIRGKILEAE